jgi:two-component system response regulator NreC
VSAHLHLAAGPREDEPVQAQTPIRVVLADDHSLVRRSLRQLLDAEANVEVVAEAADLGTVARQVHGHAPHVLVLDLQLPNGSSLELIRRLRDQAPGTGIVVLTMERNPVFAQRALDAGAVGFVLKHKSDAELPQAVRQAARGQEYVSPYVANGLEGLRRSIRADGLSPRETEVLRLIALGHTNGEIARRLSLSRRTIETHRANIQRKLGLTSRAELVEFALRRHLIGQ